MGAMDLYHIDCCEQTRLDADLFVTSEPLLLDGTASATAAYPEGVTAIYHSLEN